MIINLDSNSFFSSILISNDAAPDFSESSFTQASIGRVNLTDVNVRKLLDLHVYHSIWLTVQNVSMAHDEVFARLHIVNLRELNRWNWNGVVVEFLVATIAINS